MIETDFVLNDQACGYPTRRVATAASRTELNRFMADGFLIHRGLLSARAASGLARAVLRIAEAEAGQPGAEYAPRQSIYIRRLLDKDVSFHPLLRLEPILSLARTLLGPQVRIELEARMNYPGKPGLRCPGMGTCQSSQTRCHRFSAIHIRCIASSTSTR